MSDWQDVETAPNAEPVLAYGKSQGVCVAFRDGDDWYIDRAWNAPDDPERMYYPPTHWQPLPAAPKPE